MSSAWKIFWIVFSAVLVMVAAYWAYINYRSIKGPHATAMEAVGPDAVFFARSGDVRATLYKLTKETEYWPVLTADSLFNYFQSEIGYFDSLVASHGWLNELIELQPFTLSLNKNTDGAYNFIMMLELPPGDFIASFDDFIRSVNGEQSIVMIRDFERAGIRTVNLEGPEALFYYTVYRGLFIGSFDESLVHGSVSQLNSNRSLIRDEAFQRIHTTAGKNVEANLYIHIPNFYTWAGHHLPEKFKPMAQQLESFGTWTEIDLLVNSDDLLFNGYTISSDTSQTLLNRFRQAPQAVRVPEILPYDAAWMLHWGIQNFKDFLTATFEKEKIVSLFTGYENEFGIDLESEFVSWVGHEMVIAAAPRQTGPSHPMVILHSVDVVKAALALGGMEQKVNRKNKTSPFLLTYNDYNIRRLGLNRLFRDLLGEPFPLIENCFYVTLKDYIVFSSNELDLKQVIDNFYAKKTLIESGNYKAFSDNISDHSNIYLYANLKDPDPLLNEILAGISKTNIQKSLTQFEGFALQFSFINNMFYTNMFLSYNPEYREEVATSWISELQAGIKGQPFLVKNHRSGKNNIIVFDDDNNMYLLDHAGRRQWAVPLMEAPAGEVFMVDYYGNGKYQYLFNTTNYIYLVDLNGNLVADFPKKLMAPATGPLAVFDYDGDGDLRLMIALTDNKIHNFTLQMEPVRGWENIQVKAAVSEPLQHLRNGGKDYLVFADVEGGVKITDRRGLERIVPRATVSKAAGSSFHINRTNSKGLFLTTDRSGKVVYIDEKGKVSRTDFGDFNSDHIFFYEDFDGDDHLDFIFIDRNRMIVFDRFKNTILDQQFPEVITKKPVIFSWAGRKYMGIVLDAAGEIQVFDHLGRRFQDIYMEGEIPFVSGTLDQGHLNLITGKGNNVLSYQLN